MKEITLYLDDTTPEQFMKWLHETSSRLVRSYPAGRGIYSIQPSFENNGEKTAITARKIIDDRASDRFDVMVFSFLLAGTRLQLRIEYIDESPLMTHVFLMIDEIHKAWPETKPDEMPQSGEREIASSENPELKPWEIIPDHSWDRIAVKKWCEGYTNKEIAQNVGVTPRSVTNQISLLRKTFPNAKIPFDEERRKLMIENDTG